MNVAARVGLFVVALVAVFGAATAIGNVLTPVGTSTSAMTHDDTDAKGMPGMASSEAPGGLQIAANGYRLALDTTRSNPNQAAAVSFRILGPGGKPLTDYTTRHDKLLHFIVVKRDLSGFQHVHPTLDSRGTWTATLALTPGQWRTFADFDPAGEDSQLTLGADLAVAGEVSSKPLPTPSRTAQVDGYTVTLKGDVKAGMESKVILTVVKDGRPVTDLEPYLAAYGHLVALREGDLAYLHVHPQGAPGDGTTQPGPAITFFAEVPSVGSYRLYLDFKHGGVVRTAEFTVRSAS